MANTLYDVLEVIPTASQETIHAAYRSLITRFHPDKVAALGPELQAAANARTKEINFAYDILSDSVSRARYDEELRGEEERLTPAVAAVVSPRRPAPSFSNLSAVRPEGAAVDKKRSKRGAGDEPRQRRHVLATLSAAVAGITLVLALPPAANLIFGAVEFSLTGHARFFFESENPIDAKGDFSSSAYLLVLWGWLFANYLFGLVSYRVGVLVGETVAARFGGSFAATNDRLFLFLSFVCVVATVELFFSAHTMGNMLADMFVLAGAYLAERGIA